jgi:hypothetical protein
LSLKFVYISIAQLEYVEKHKNKIKNFHSISYHHYHNYKESETCISIMQHEEKRSFQKEVEKTLILIKSTLFFLFLKASLLFKSHVIYIYIYIYASFTFWLTMVVMIRKFLIFLFIFFFIYIPIVLYLDKFYVLVWILTKRMINIYYVI